MNVFLQKIIEYKDAKNISYYDMKREHLMLSQKNNKKINFEKGIKKQNDINLIRSDNVYTSRD